jgi:hypothetical protein
MDWSDEAWNEFLKSEELDVIAVQTPTMQMLKRAWLHGAKAGVAKAQQFVAEMGAPRK